MLKNRKTNLITNSLIELGLEEDEGKGKGRYFVSKFIEAGLAHYKELGDILITKETLDKFIQTMVGCPVIIDHEDVNDKNVDKLRVGVISRVWYNEADGWYYCEGILTDNEAIDLVKNKGWSVSCSYSFVSDDTQKTYHGKPIDMEFTDGEFLHLAIVKDPRYEGANIVVNSNEKFKTEEHPRNKIGEFIKKAKEKGFNVKEEYFKEYTGKPKYYNDNKTLDRRPFVEGNTAYYYPETDLIAIGHEYGHLFAKNNPEVYKEYEKLFEDFEEFVYKDVRISSIDELFAEALAHYINDEDDEEIQKIKTLLDEHYFNKKAKNSIYKENTIMSVLNELKDFILGVVNNEKEDEMKVKNEDKRKLIDEIGGILKDKVDDEIIRTVIKKAEELSYEPSEDDKTDNKKAKNEDDEDKDEAKNKCKNEEDKEEKEKVEDEEDKEEDPTKNEEDKEEEEKTENKKVKNSMKDFVMGGKTDYEEKPLYTSRAKRLAEGNKY